jgi:hypothetical protein
VKPIDRDYRAIKPRFGDGLHGLTTVSEWNRRANFQANFVAAPQLGQARHSTLMA